jgi:acyl-CoA reductase-like NAD-dependent aldehyde dehydrogenase
VQQSGYPTGAISILPCSNDDAAPLLDDVRVRMITFTGSGRVGWMIRQRAPMKRVTLELGGNAAVMIEPDADIDRAVERCVVGGYLYAGQSCISTQRILVHDDVYERFVERFVARVGALRTGDPLADTTDVGPMIDQANAERAEAWIAEARAAGARVAVGGRRTGAVLEPAVLLDTAGDMRVNCQELFAPVTTVRRYADFDAAIADVNDSPYGLQAGLFTNDMRRILRAFELVEVGGLVINDVPGYRVDHAPYGGVKESGHGREGVRYAIEEMTELRLLVLGGQ